MEQQGLPMLPQMDQNMSALFVQLMRNHKANLSDFDAMEVEFPDMSNEEIQTESATTRKSYVTTEEAVIVFIVLFIWIAVIVVFVRKWGKIRGMEPFTPTFDQSASFAIPPPAPLSSIMKKGSSASRDTITSSHQFNKISDDSKTQDYGREKFVMRMPYNNGTKRARGSSASSPDIRFTQSQRMLPAARKVIQEKENLFSNPDIIEENKEPEP